MPGFSMRLSYKDAKKLHKQVEKEVEETEKEDGHGHGHGGNNGYGKGIVKDFKQTVGTWWVKEMVNFNTKTIAVSIFLFIAVIAPCITFGAVYAKRTNNAIGASELLLATAWCGIFYALVGGMPLMINGATGPVLTFQALLFSLSKNLDVPFLTVSIKNCQLHSHRCYYPWALTDKIFLFVLPTVQRVGRTLGCLLYGFGGVCRFE